ncbi:type II secretion system protein [Arcobacter sp.]|jgi:hypothetical protein|uniref:type II secretion system protein n=1 Tax=Arcobacter sp. TaxID=1872629 RepID=UPI003C7713FD|tara:strand:- start:95 stop:736 length:642 start_codon:yes stop_codon:yes gene_type:complete
MCEKLNSKKSYFLFEIIFVILLISYFSYSLLPKNTQPEFKVAIDRLVLYLNQTRLQAFIDDKYDLSNPKWFRKRWTLKFFNCSENVGGIYYSIYSDTNMAGHPNADESLKDPLTKKYIYSSNSCEENNSNSEYVLLTKKFGIKNISMTCNSTTSSIGQLSFGSDGKVYSRLSTDENDDSSYLLNEDCTIKFISNKGDISGIKVYANTGFIEKL